MDKIQKIIMDRMKTTTPSVPSTLIKKTLPSINTQLLPGNFGFNKPAIVPTQKIVAPNVVAKTRKPVVVTPTPVKKPTGQSEDRTMRISYYNATGNPMANGKMPKEGYVATSDRTIPLGSTVVVDGKSYIVGDRTAKWVGDKSSPRYKGDTIDIFKNESPAISMKRGVQTKKVNIRKK